MGLVLGLVIVALVLLVIFVLLWAWRWLQGLLGGASAPAQGGTKVVSY